MAEFQQTSTSQTAEEVEKQSSLALDAMFSTLPEPSELASDRDTGVFVSVCAPSSTANEIIREEDIKLYNAQISGQGSPRLERDTQLPAEGSPRPERETQLLDHCEGEGSTPRIPSESGENLSFGATEMSLPPMVDSVTNNMLKVSINHPLTSIGEQLLQNSLANSEIEMSFMIPAYDRGDVFSQKVGELLSSQYHASIVEADAPSLQLSDCKMGHISSMDGNLQSLIEGGSKFASEKEFNNINDDDDDDNEDKEEEEEEEADNGGIDSDDNDKDVNDSALEVEEDSDSSSSTSSLSFLSSSSDDDEIANLHCLLNSGSNQKDLAMEVESECEEGELKESPSQRKKGRLNKKTKNEGSEGEDEEGLKEPVQSTNKTNDLPRVPKVSVTLEPHHQMVPVGFVASVVGVSLIVEGIEGQSPLNDGSILWLTDHRLPLGIVDELFGPVKKPFYVVRYNDATEMPEEAKEGVQVSYVRDFADFVLNNPDIYLKGYDEADNDNLSDSEVYFSDDEKEAEYKRLQSRMKRGNSETSVPRVNNRQHQEKKTGGKRSNKESKNWKSRGESTRTFHSNNEFSGRSPRHQSARFQHHRSEREPSPLGNRVELMHPSNQQIKYQRGNQSPAYQVPSQQSLGVGPLKPLTPESSTSDGVQTQTQSSKMYQLQRTSSPISQKPMLRNLLCSSSQPLQMNQPQSFTQPPSQQMQPLHTIQLHNLTPSTSQQIQMNQPQGLMQSALLQSLPWQSNQQQLTPLQHPNTQHSQMLALNHAVVAGQVAQGAISGYGMPLTSKPADTVQGFPPGYQSPLYQQQVPTLNQFSSSMPHHFSGQGSQVLPNMGMPMGNQLQNVHANSYPVRVQPAALGEPVLGIPAGPANAPFNYSMQVGCSFPGFNPGCTPAFANQNLPSAYSVPEQVRTMQGTAGTPAASLLQHHSPQDSLGPGLQQPFQGPGSEQPFYQRRHFSEPSRGPYQGRRF